MTQHFTLTVDHLRKIARKGKSNDNMRSVVMAIHTYGVQFHMDPPWRLAQYIAQAAHETMYFTYDREVWGPTPAQARYDTRTDLGNTPEKDGDGKLRSGKGPFQLTGGYNQKAFTVWCRKYINPSAPDFYANPDAINTDPWEGLSAVWFWTTHDLNKLADSGDIEQIRKKINGGLNGYAAVLEAYTRTAMVFLGYDVRQSVYAAQISKFQEDAQSMGFYPMDAGIDGDPGPKTRAALHRSLLVMETGKAPASPDIRSAPVVEEKQIVVTPKGADKTGALRLAGLGALLSPITGFFVDFDQTGKLILLGVVVAAVLFMLWRGERVASRVKSVAKAFGGE